MQKISIRFIPKYSPFLLFLLFLLVLAVLEFLVAFILLQLSA